MQHFLIVFLTGALGHNQYFFTFVTYTMQRRILFIINPKAGKKRPDLVIDLIHSEIAADLSYELLVWKEKDDFIEISSRIKSLAFSDVVAAGGDGTVNRVAHELVGTGISLGILPLGSGNGLARSLGLSMNLNRCLQQIVTGRMAVIDSGKVNGHAFFCTAGTGFDAHIGHLFASSLRRGLRSYVQIIAREILRYKAREYVLHLNGTTLRRKAFLITVANAGQYGNDFYIAPQASICDGKFHVVILHPFNVLKLTSLLSNIMRRKAYLSRSIETFVCDQVTIEREGEDSVHFDGEPLLEEAELIFEMLPRSLKVLVGEGFISD